MGSGPKTENKGQKTALNFSVPKAAIYKSGTRPNNEKTRSPFFNRNPASTLANLEVWVFKSP